MEVYFNPHTQTAYATDGTHLTIHQIAPQSPIISQAQADHLTKVFQPLHRETAHRQHDFTVHHA